MGRLWLKPIRSLAKVSSSKVYRILNLLYNLVRVSLRHSYT